MPYLWADMRRHPGWRDLPGGSPYPDRREPLGKAVSWLLHAQEMMTDGGFGSYHLVEGWSSSYPETTGYIIPTLLEYFRRTGEKTVEEAALKAAGFLVGIQRPFGGWQGGRVNENKPEVVFNTAQVIRGLLGVHGHTRDKTFLSSALKGCDWLCSVQSPEGYWKKNALMEQPRVYDTYVDVPLLMAWRLTGIDAYRVCAERNIRWVIGMKSKPNGWFEDCDNTMKRNDRPILHTIAYTLDGLLDASEFLDDTACFHAALPGAGILREQFLADGILKGRYDEKWTGSEHFICTGGAQMALVWMKIFRLNNDQGFLEAADRMIALLINIQSRMAREPKNTAGAMPGSFPLWGRYEPFGYPNWATKYFCDALMMRDSLNP